MAKKRLNKRLLTILAVVGGAVLVIGLILFVQYRYRDPLPFFEKARELVQKVHQEQEAIDAQVSQISDPEQAYLRRMELMESDSMKQLRAETDDHFSDAFGYSRDNITLKTEVGMELADYYLMIKDYRRSRGVWNKLVEINPSFVPAKYKIVKSIYDICQVGARYAPSVASWAELKQQAEGYIAIAPDEAYGYQVQAQAMLGILQIGGDESPDRSLEELDTILVKAEQLGGPSVILFDLKGQLAQVKAEQSLDDQEKTEFLVQAQAAYQQAMDSYPDDPQGYFNRFSRYDLPTVGKLFGQVRTATLEENREALKAQAQAAEAQALEKVEQAIARFPKDGRFYHLKAQTLLLDAQADEMDPIIAMYQQAVKVEPDEPKWPVELATFYRLQTLYSEVNRESLQAVYHLLRRALFLPKATNQEGFDRVEVMTYRIRNLQIQIELGASLVENSDDNAEKERYLSAMRQCFAELRDLIGVLNPNTKISQGTLARAEGKRDEAVKYYYEAEQEMSNQGIRNPILSLQLFYVLRETSNRSLATKHAFIAIQAGHRSPKLLLDVMETLERVGTTDAMIQLNQLVSFFETTYTPTQVQQQQLATYQAKSLLALGQKEAAHKVLEEDIDDDSFDYRLLQVRTQENLEKRIALLESLVRDYPGKEQLVSDLFHYYLSRGRDDSSYYDRARDMVQRALKTNPDHISYQQMLAVLAQDDPGQLDSQALEAKFVELAKNISDPFEREKQLGVLLRQQAAVHQQKGEAETVTKDLQQARKHFQAAFDLKNDDTDMLVQAYNICLTLKDWDEAKTLAERVTEIDSQRGQLLSVELLLVRQKFDDAITVMEPFVAEHPTSVSAHTQLARAYAGLNRPEDALAEIRRAIELDATDVSAKRILVLLLHQQYAPRGLDSLAESSLREMVKLINEIYDTGGREERFLRLRLVYEPQLMVLTHRQLSQIQGLSDDDRDRAEKTIDLIYQRSVEGGNLLCKNHPTDVSIWQGLVDVYQQYLSTRSDPDEQQALREKIDQVYHAALAANPDSVAMITIYGQHLLQTDRSDEAEQVLQELLAKSSGEQKQNVRLQMVQMYGQLNDTDKMKTLLEELLLEDPGNISGLKMMGELLAKQNELDEAIKIYAKLCKQESTDLLVARQAELLLRAKRIEEADALLAQARQTYPESISVLLISSQLEINKTNYSAALAYVDRVLERDANHLGAIKMKAKVLYYDQQLDASMEMMRQLRRIVGPGSVIGRPFRAQLYAAQARYSDAMDELRGVLKINPENEAVRNQLIRIMIRGKRWLDIEALYDEILKLYPESINIHLQAARAAMNYGDVLLRGKQNRLASQQYTQSDRLLNQTIELCRQQNVSSDLVLDAQMNLFLKTQRYQEVLDVLGPLLAERGEHPTFLLHQAEALNRLGQSEQALATFEKALKLTEKNPALNDQVLNAVGRVGKMDTILAWAESKVAQRPDWIALRVLLAQIYSAKGQNEKALASYEKALEQTQDKNQIVRLKYAQAITYERMKNREKAIELSREILTLDPDHVVTLNNLAYFLMEQGGHDEEALNMAQRAYDRNKNNPDVIDTYAVALLKKEKDAEAEVLLRQAIQLKQRESQDVWAELYYHLGQALVGTGQTDRARRQFEIALQQIDRGKVTSDADTLRQEIEAARDRL